VRELRSPFFGRAAEPAFYFEDNPDGRLGPEQLTGEEALEQAKALARAEQDKLEPIRKSHRGCLS
jgi:hypothetical protein